MLEDSVSIKRIIDAWKKGEYDYSSNADAKKLAELLVSIRSELQLVDKTSKKREILQWYLNNVKSILEDYVITRLLKSMSVSIKKIEEISQDANSLSWFSTIISEELDLTRVISQSVGSLKNRKVMAIVLKDVDKFVGEDGKEYGPYPAGSLINIPYYIARILEEKNAIEEIFIT
ncbi:MAG: hypothetical protein RMI79_07625 [Nitrososphaerota archaeon]|nr:hypothetical protein [Nitrososphaerota archaeon]